MQIHSALSPSFLITGLQRLTSSRAVWIRYDPVMASAGLIGMSNSLATYGRCGRQHRGRCCGNTLNCSQALLEWQFKLNKQENRHVEGSKRK
jgi:hypothetical protein